MLGHKSDRCPASCWANYSLPHFSPTTRHFFHFWSKFAGLGPWEGSHQVRTAVSCKSPVSIPRELPPGPENCPVFLPGKILLIFGPRMIASPWGTLMEKEGTDNVYLDTQVMGSNPGIRSRSCGEVPKFQKSNEVDIIWPDGCKV